MSFGGYALTSTEHRSANSLVCKLSFGQRKTYQMPPIHLLTNLLQGEIMKTLKLTALTLLLLGGTLILSAENQMPVIAAFQGEHHASFYGYSMTSLDFNHDGIDDLAVCSFAYGFLYGESSSRGKVYIYLGEPGFSSTTPASITLEGDYTGSIGRRILGVFNVGDISGDGFDDLCIYVEDYLSPNYSFEKLMFYYGGASGLEVYDHEIPMYGDGYTSGTVYPLGDVNGDGYDDMGISYRHTPTHTNSLSIIWGGSLEEQIIYNGEINHTSSFLVYGIGDINNDGYDDFTTTFGTTQDDSTHNLVQLYYGNAEGNFDNPVTILCYQYIVFRGSNPLGDINGDGYDDFMGYATSNGIYIWLGGQEIDFTVPEFLLDPPWCGFFAQRSLEHGDFNGDGYEDIAGPRNSRGFAVWLGKKNVNGTADLIVGTPGGHENYGRILVTGDFNADGYDDIAVSAPHENDPWPHGNYNGYVWVHAGNPQLEDTTVATDDPAIPSISDNLVVKLSPNPITRADNTLNIELQPKAPSEHEQIAVEIYNIKGQSVHKEVYQAQMGARTYQVPASTLANGIYLCRVTRGKQQTTGKFCVIK